MRRTIFLLIAIAFAIVPVISQDRPIKPLPENASFPETQKWLVDTIGKHATFKTRVTSAVVSAPKFEGCELSYLVTRKTSGANQDVMGVTTRVHTTKQDVAFDLSHVPADGISVTDHIFPEFQTIVLRYHKDPAPPREIEIVVKYEAAEAIKSALSQALVFCRPKN